ncbi:hypothetical protein HMPREF0880_00078 [Yokenella regensburgei ATCC 43003]|jgi:hypothetical protein|nr:hypothetical protein HMPREF0880_00078 [Yokenella regensburgei ATCC 43003]
MNSQKHLSLRQNPLSLSGDTQSSDFHSFFKNSRLTSLFSDISSILKGCEPPHSGDANLAWRVQ